MTALFEFGSHSIIGARESQEDNCAFHSISHNEKDGDQPFSGEELLAVLADGMGGHVGGAKASETVSRTFISSYCYEHEHSEDALVKALKASNQAIASSIENDRSLKGMGSTLIGAVMRAEGLRWISIGDSLLYLYRDQELFRLNQDHSFGALLDAMVRKGEMDADEAENDPRRGSLLSAISGEELDLIDLHDIDIPLDREDWVILASDGLQTLNRKLIANIIHMNEVHGADGVAKALTQAVKDVNASHQDNTTVMVIRLR